MTIIPESCPAWCQRDDYDGADPTPIHYAERELNHGASVRLGMFEGQTLLYPSLPAELTPAQLRRIALDLVSAADDAEGLAITQRPVEAWEIVAELAQLRERIARIEEREQVA